MENKINSNVHEEPSEVITYSFDEFQEMFHVKHFLENLSEWNIFLSDEQLKQFFLYYKYLLKWNTVMNLTAITELQDVLEKHFFDSLAIIKLDLDCLKKDNSCKLIDIGTGAGFPGIPISIVYPSIKITLMDSLNKRVNFLNGVIELLDLKNVKVIHARAEELARDKKHREQYDLVCSRAVAELNVLSEYCLPFAKVTGDFIAYKSEKSAQEINEAENALKILGGKIHRVENYSIPETDYARTLIDIQKIKNTSNKYPRKAGTPAKDPII